MMRLVAKLNEPLQGDRDGLDSPVEDWNAETQDEGGVGDEQAAID
jgi:hypothetical protein